MPDYQVFDELHRSRLKGALPVFEGSMDEVYKHLNGRRAEMHELSVKNTKTSVVSRASIWFVAARRVIITDLVYLATMSVDEMYPEASTERIVDQVMEMF